MKNRVNNLITILTCDTACAVVAAAFAFLVGFFPIRGELLMHSVFCLLIFLWGVKIAISTSRKWSWLIVLVVTLIIVAKLNYLMRPDSASVMLEAILTFRLALKFLLSLIRKKIVPSDLISTVLGFASLLLTAVLVWRVIAGGNADFHAFYALIAVAVTVGFLL